MFDKITKKNIRVAVAAVVVAAVAAAAATNVYPTYFNYTSPKEKEKRIRRRSAIEKSRASKKPTVVTKTIEHLLVTWDTYTRSQQRTVKYFNFSFVESLIMVNKRMYTAV